MLISEMIHENRKSHLVFFLCGSLVSVVYGADSNILSSSNSQICVGSHSAMSIANKQKNLSVLIEGYHSHVDLTQVQISDTLKIDINSYHNTVVINHPNKLELTINSYHNRVINLCRAAENSKIVINGYHSEYKVSSPLNYYLFGSPLRTFTTLSVAGMLAFFLYKSPWVRNSIQQIFRSKNNQT
jgi:hypothetical protein